MNTEDKDDYTRYSDHKIQSCKLDAFIYQKAWNKMAGICTSTNIETSGLFLWKLDGEKAYIIHTFILPQTGAGASTEIRDGSIYRLIRLLTRFKIIGAESDGTMRLGWWHTHPTFGTFWSGTDMNTRALLSRGCEYYLSIVINQKGEYCCAIDINEPVKVSIDKINLTMIEQENLKEYDYKAIKDRFVSEYVYESVEYQYSTKPWLDNEAPFTSLDRAIWKEDNGIPLSWWEQEALDMDMFIRLNPDVPPEVFDSYMNVGGKIIKISELGGVYDY
jgi:proteasome lid subunit RPN8/RPN11